jgi:hypothetical protein
MSSADAAKSIYELPPLNTGAIEARDGFAFQDHVALGFCLEMVENESLFEVWCETLDDITLIWKSAENIQVEFIQVKGSEMDQLWSVALLCGKDNKGSSSSLSIMEKSLVQDRCTEPCRFRLVTARPVMDEIEILTQAFDSLARKDGEAKFDAIHQLMAPKVGTFRSANGNDHIFWTRNTYWDVRHAEDAIRNSNLLKLGKILSSNGISLAPDQADEIYAKLLKKVWDVSRVDPRVFPEEKRIKRIEFQSSLLRMANEAGLPTAGATEKLEAKMKLALLSADMIGGAVEQTRYYRGEQLRPKYLNLDSQRLVQAEVMALLQNLKSRLDNGELPDDGKEFHGLCLKELQTLREQLPVAPLPPLAFLQGCMYSIAGRCLHRFRRVTA